MARSTNAIPGQAITYTIVVSNAAQAAGAFNASLVGTFATGTFPATGATGGLQLTNVTTSGGASSSFKTPITITLPLAISSLNDTITMPGGSSITYTVSGTILASATSPSVAVPSFSANADATVKAGSGETNISSSSNETDTDNLTPECNLVFTKKDSAGGNSATGADGTAIPGTNITYTISVTNTGPSEAQNFLVSDTLPALLSSASLAAPTLSAGASDTGATLGSSSPYTLSDTVTLAVGASITYYVTAAIPATATGPLPNTANLTIPLGPTQFTDANSTSAPVTDTLMPKADLIVTVSDNHGGSSSGSSGNVQPNGSVAYTITVSNAGPSDVPTVIVSDYLSESMLGAITSASLGTPAARERRDRHRRDPGGFLPLHAQRYGGPCGPRLRQPQLRRLGPIRDLGHDQRQRGTGTLANTATVSVAGTGVTNTGTTPVTDTDTLAKCRPGVEPLGAEDGGHRPRRDLPDQRHQLRPRHGPDRRVTDTLPAGMTFVSATSSNAAMLPVATTVNGNGTTTVTFTGTSMGVGASETIAIDATVSSNVASGKTLTNNVTVSSAPTQATNGGRCPSAPPAFTTQVNVNGASLVPDMLPECPRNDGPGDHRRARRQQHDPGLARDRRLRGLRRRPRAGTFAATGRIIVYGSGNDYEWISSSIKLSAWLYGGSGTNHLDGGAGNNVIIGGPGTNYISGGAGWNLLIGGGGGKAANYIYGTTGNNIEISGTTSYDASNPSPGGPERHPARVGQHQGTSTASVSTRSPTPAGTGLMRQRLDRGSQFQREAGLPSTIQRVAAYEYLYGSSSGQNLFFATETGIATDRDYVSGANNNLSAHDWLELS